MASRLKGFSVCHINVRSLPKNFNEAYVTLDGFDVITISETWLQEQVASSQLKFPGYSLYRQDRSEGIMVKKRGGGIAVYVKEHLQPFTSPIPTQNSVTSNLEQYWIEINKPNYKRQIICVVYRPPSGILHKFEEELTSHIDLLETTNSVSYELTLLGDFNINYTNNSSSEFKILKELERTYQLKQYIFKPTRVTNKVKSTIDLIFSNMVQVSESGVMNDYMIADHFPVYILKKKIRNDKCFQYVYGRSYKHYNTIIFQDLISSNMKWRSYWNKTSS